MTLAFIDLLGLACMFGASDDIQVADFSPFLVNDKRKIFHHWISNTICELVY